LLTSLWEGSPNVVAEKIISALEFVKRPNGGDKIKHLKLRIIANK